MRINAKPTVRRVSALACTSLALLILAVSSAFTVEVLWSFGRTDFNDLDALGVVVTLPVALALVGILGSLALLAQRRKGWIIITLWGACVLLMIPPPLVALSGAAWMDTHHWRAPFGAAAVSAIMVLCVAVNGAALYAAWRSVLRAGPRNSA